ncbi:histidine kinase [Agromyces sp. SYSU K20354]|uniref:sensor histidine kinase n=1 Tax=Agromyces cavernae TaxID=2898659 RepID=UPI001E322AB3|nr:ATP-binding protein [Agromyces cavernae]MCD2443058.1 histidine kinase [Agromyces cavernae]
MSRDVRGRRVAATVVWAVSWALALASLLIAWSFGLPQEPLPGVTLSPAPAELHSRFDDLGVTVALIYGPVSALILIRRPHPVGVILAVHAVGSGVTAFGVQYGLLGAEVPGLPLWGLFAFAAGWGFVPGTFMTAALPLLIRRGTMPGWQRGVVVIAMVVAAVAFVLSLTQQSVPEPRNPFAITVPAYQAIVPGLYAALSFVGVAIAFLSLGVLIVRWARSGRGSRAGVAWLTLGHAFLTLSYFALVLPEGLDVPPWATWFGMVAPMLGQVLYPAAILVVVLGQRLWGVELIVSRIVLWSLLTISGMVLYLGLVALLPAVLAGGFTVGPVGGLWFVVPVLIALVAQPVRAWLQRRIDVLVYGEGADPAVLLERLGDRIGELEPGSAGLRQVCEALRLALRLGAVEVRSVVRPELAAAAGSASGEPVVLPLRAHGRRIGELIMHPRHGQRFDARTLRLFADIAGLVAAALQLIDTNLVLEGARRDLIARRVEERRAIRRELHDAIGPSLAGVGFGLAAVENLLEGDRDRRKAESLLAELGDELTRRVRDVRSLADAVTPSPLEGASLDAALADLAGRFDAPGREIRRRVDLEPRHAVPRDVQDGAYLIAAEAIANAVRHSDAGRIDVDVVAHDSSLEVRVADDGSGIAPGAPRGVGLRSMRERAFELRGSLEVKSGASGTTVLARLPLPGPAATEEPGAGRAVAER